MDKKTRTHITIINQGVDFIIDHLFDKISVDMIADHCCFSRHYLNRLFRSVTGESIYGFIKRLRLETAAFRLIKFPHMSITHLAADIGYSASNFAVVFKEHYGVSPSQFRANPCLPEESETQTVLRRIRDLQENKPDALLKQMDRKTAVKELPDIRVVYQRFKGNYQDLPNVWHTFCADMEKAYKGSGVQFFGISYDDPLIVGADNCLYDLCARPQGANKRLWATGITDSNTRTIPGGTYLCYRFDGHVSRLKGIYNDLFAVWMPHRGYIVGQGLCYERYYDGSGPSSLVMDICIPVLG